MSEAARIRSGVERGDPDAILARMRADRDSDWPLRLAARIADEPALLTGREALVLRCASVGLTIEQTADALGLTRQTIEHHRDSGRLRLRAKNTPHAVALALRQGLIA